MRALQLALRVVLRSLTDRTPSTAQWTLNYRQLSSRSILLSSEKHGDGKPVEKQQKEQSSSAGSWHNWFGAARSEPAVDVPSKLLVDNRSLYELQTHNVIPQLSEKYHHTYAEYVPKLLQRSNDIQLVGSWRVAIGDEDQFIHLWKYPGDFSHVPKFLDAVRGDKSLVEFNQKIQPCLKSRRSELYQKFSNWNDPAPRQSKHVYEIRTYHLKAGAMLEWGNYWARGIRIHRRNYEPVIGMCSQVGRLYLVQHIWAYDDDIASGKEMHEEAWQVPGWGDMVQNILPLIRQMDSNIMRPMLHSPLQ